MKNRIAQGRSEAQSAPLQFALLIPNTAQRFVNLLKL